MARRNDQVFQLSLTEIAFTVSFILLLLLGYLVFREQAERREAERALAEVTSSERATAAMKEAQQQFQEALGRGGVANPSEIISRLLQGEAVREERDRLRRQVEDLDAKLTALVEIQRSLETMAPADRETSTRDSVLSALALEAQINKVLEQAQAPAPDNHPFGKAASGRPARAEQVKMVKDAIAATTALKAQFKEQLGVESLSSEGVREVVRDAKRYRELAKSGATGEAVKKENSDLRGQVAFLKNRLYARGGRDYPPCWADEAGKVEFLFSVELRADGVLISRAWPERRASDAAALPGVSDALAKAHPQSEFPGKVQPVLDWSRRQDPECRHYVQLRSTIPDAVQSDRARLMVENFFYKVEARR